MGLYFSRGPTREVEEICEFDVRSSPVSFRYVCHYGHRSATGLILQSEILRKIAGRGDAVNLYSHLASPLPCFDVLESAKACHMGETELNATLYCSETLKLLLTLKLPQL